MVIWLKHLTVKQMTVGSTVNISLCMFMSLTQIFQPLWRRPSRYSPWVALYLPPCLYFIIMFITLFNIIIILLFKSANSRLITPLYCIRARAYIMWNVMLRYSVSFCMSKQCAAIYFFYYYNTLSELVTYYVSNSLIYVVVNKKKVQCI